MTVAEPVHRDPVLRNSVDWQSREATRRRPYSTGRASDAKIRNRALIQVADELQRSSIAAGPKRFRGALGHCGPRVLEAILRRLDFSKGFADSALSQIAADVGCKDRKMVLRLRDRLIAAGFLETLRRSRRTGAPKRFGVPQREQISNITYPTPHRLPPELYTRYLELCAKFRAEESARFRKAAKVPLVGAQQRAERRSARRKSALAERQPTETRRPSASASLAQMNPVGAARVLRLVTQSFDRNAAKEQEQAQRVAENLPELLAEIDRLCGKHASPS